MGFLKDLWNSATKSEASPSEMSFFISFEELKNKFGLRGEVSKIYVDDKDQKLKITTKII